jgi:protein disulfide-isomerase
MKSVLSLCIALLLVGTTALTYRSQSNELTWETNFQNAITKAQKEKKKLFVNFTGSDWCGWCIRLDKEVFSKEAFVNYANDNFVCVKLDFPRNTALTSDAEKQQNKDLAIAYKVQGFPTILVLDTDKNVLMTTGYQFGGVDAYIEHLKEGLKK